MNKNRLNKSLCVFVVVFVSFFFTSNLLLAQEKGTGREIGKIKRQLKQLIQQKRAEGLDVSEAIQLDMQSKEAIQQGRKEKGLGFLKEAIVLLENGAIAKTKKAASEVDATEYISFGYEDSPFGIHDFLKFSDEEIKNAKDLGVKWVRLSGVHSMAWGMVEKTKGTYDWRRTDAIISKLRQGGFNIMWTIKSFNQWDQGVSEPNQKAPKDLKAYSDFVYVAVERYKDVKYWQIENELDGNFWRDTPEAFAELLKTGYKAIKRANPDAKVLIGGVSVPKGFYDFYIDVLKELSNLGGKYFDIMDVHWYEYAGDYKTHPVGNYNLTEFMQDLKIKLKLYGYNNIDVWFTEVGTYSGTNVKGKFGRLRSKQDEFVQAVELLRRYVYFRAYGVSKIFWHTILEKRGGDDLFSNIGLVHNGQGADDLGYGVKKLAYYTYKKMVEVLEGSDWNNIQTIRESGGIYIYKFLKDDKPVWVAWNDNEDLQRVRITLDNDTKNVKITEAVPRYKSGKEVKDYNTAFRVIRHNIMESYPLQVEFELGESPVFMDAVE